MRCSPAGYDRTLIAFRSPSARNIGWLCGVQPFRAGRTSFSARIALRTRAMPKSPPAAAPDAKTTAMDDWHTLEIVSVGVQPPNHSPAYLEVHAGDLDGDGLPDDAYLRLTCDAGKLQQAAYEVKSPRDIATGQASGKRQHG